MVYIDPVLIGDRIRFHQFIPRLKAFLISENVSCPQLKVEAFDEAEAFFVPDDAVGLPVFYPVYATRHDNLSNVYPIRRKNIIFVALFLFFACVMPQP